MPDEGEPDADPPGGDAGEPRPDCLPGSGLTLRALLGEFLDRTELRYDADAAVTGVATGFVVLDQALGGLQPAELIVVGGRPATGKTAMVLKAATNVALGRDQPPRPVLVCSIESSPDVVVRRLVSAEAQVDSSRLRSGSLWAGEWKGIAGAMGRLFEADLHVEGAPRMTAADVAATSREFASAHGDVALVVVDSLQLLTGRPEVGTRPFEVADMVRELKLLARELECPVLVTSHLNRGAHERYDKRPVLTDLRDSGAIEDDSDVVLLLHREELYDEATPDKGVVEVIVAKHRGGRCGTTKLALVASYGTLADIASTAPTATTT